MMNFANVFKSRGAVLFLAAVLVAATAGSAAWACIPESATIDSATFRISIGGPSGEVVRVHRITAPWLEDEVTWNNFGGAYDPFVEASYTADTSGYVDVDVTDLVRDWVDGTYPNYGFFLEQGRSDLTSHRSSEEAYEFRPELEICYSTSAGPSCITIKRPGAEQDGVADSTIWELYPDSPAGDSLRLYTGMVNEYEKQALVRFEFELCPPDDPLGCRFTGGGVDTDGNWDHTLEDGEMIRNGAGNLPEGVDRAQFGGQAGASTAQQPQPSGEWTHHQQRGPSGAFTFHGGTSSAPAGTEVDEIRCMDPGGCRPSGDPPSPVKQLDFDGIGTFKNIGKGRSAPTFEIANPTVTAEGNGNKAFDGTFHWFEVNIDDLGERGGMNTGAPDSETCPSAGFGEKGAVELADCDCPDFYRITIYNGVDAGDVVWVDGSIDPTLLRAQEVLYEFYGYIDGGNLQIHHPTGRDR
jgi:hypothetical protein